MVARILLRRLAVVQPHGRSRVLDVLGDVRRREVLELELAAAVEPGVGHRRKHTVCAGRARRPPVARVHAGGRAGSLVRAVRAPARVASSDVITRRPRTCSSAMRRCSSTSRLGGGSGIKRGRRRADHGSGGRQAALRGAREGPVWRGGGHVIGAYLPADDDRINISRDFLRARQRRAARPLQTRDTCAGPGRRDGTTRSRSLADADPHALDAGRSGEDHAPGGGDAAAAGLARREGERGGASAGRLGLYGTPAMAAEAGMGPRAVLGADHPRLLFLDAEDPIAPLGARSASGSNRTA